MEKNNINDVSLYLFIKGIIDTKYYVIVLSLLFLLISYFFLDNKDNINTYTIPFEINDNIDLSYSQKINSIVISNQEIIDVSKINGNNIIQITDVVQKYLNDIQQTSLIDISYHKIMNMFFDELKKTTNQDKMKISNLNMLVQDESPLNNYYENENKKVINLIISLDVPDINIFEKNLINIDLAVKKKLITEVDTLISNFEYLKKIKEDKISEKLKERKLKAKYFKQAKLDSLRQKIKIANTLGIVDPSGIESLKEITNLNERMADIDVYPKVLNEFLNPQNIQFRYVDSLSEIIFKGSIGLTQEINEIENITLDQFLYREGLIKDFDIYMAFIQTLEVLKSNDAVVKIMDIRNNLSLDENDNLLVKIKKDRIVNNKASLIDKLRIYIISLFLGILIGVFLGFILNRVNNEARIYKSKFKN